MLPKLLIYSSHAKNYYKLMLRERFEVITFSIKIHSITTTLKLHIFNVKNY